MKLAMPKYGASGQCVADWRSLFQAGLFLLITSALFAVPSRLSLVADGLLLGVEWPGPEARPPTAVIVTATTAQVEAAWQVSGELAPGLVGMYWVTAAVLPVGEK